MSTIQELAVTKSGHCVLPVLIVGAGEWTAWRFVEFFTANVRNANTRAAYGRAAGAFLRWCENAKTTGLYDRRNDDISGRGSREDWDLKGK